MGNMLKTKQNSYNPNLNDKGEGLNKVIHLYRWTRPS